MLYTNTFIVFYTYTFFVLNSVTILSQSDEHGYIDLCGFTIIDHLNGKDVNENFADDHPFNKMTFGYGSYDIMILHAMILRYKDCDAADDNLCDDTLKQRQVALDRANNAVKCDVDDYQDREINLAEVISMIVKMSKKSTFSSSE